MKIVNDVLPSCKKWEWWCRIRGIFGKSVCNGVKQKGLFVGGKGEGGGGGVISYRPNIIAKQVTLRIIMCYWKEDTIGVK